MKPNVAFEKVVADHSNVELSEARKKELAREEEFVQKISKSIRRSSSGDSQLGLKLP